MIVFCGIGYFEENLLKFLHKDKKLLIIDKDAQKIDNIKKTFPNITSIVGDASSLLIWKKLNLSEIDFVITTFRDSDISYEISFIIRKTFNLTIPILVLIYNRDNIERFSEFGVTIVNPLDIATNIVINKIERNFSRSFDIGLKKGELIELNVMSKSHLTDKTLRVLKPSNWNLAALYRNNEIVIPSDNTKIEVGDKIILFGEPKVLENLVNIFLKGIPQFPLQYGKNSVSYIFSEVELSQLAEVVYLTKNIRAANLLIKTVDFKYYEDMRSRVINDPNFNKSYTLLETDSILKYLNENDAGINIFQLKKYFTYKKLKIKEVLRNSIKPTAILKGNFPYEKVIVSLNTPDMIHSIEVAIELGRLFNLPIEIFIVVMPKGLRSKDEETKLNDSYKILADFKTIYKTPLPYTVLEGNPIKVSLQFLKDKKNTLLIMGYEKFNIGNFLNPSIGYSVALKSIQSTISIPQSVD